MSVLKWDSMWEAVGKDKQLTSPLVLVATEGVASSEGSSSDLLHILTLQPQTGATSGHDGTTAPGWVGSKENLLTWCKELHLVSSELQIWLRGGATGTA